MKRIWLVLLTLVLALSFCACDQSHPMIAQAFKLPDDTHLLGIDLSGLTKEEAWNTLESAAESYTLELDVDGNVVTVDGKDMGLGCSRDVFMAGMDALEAGSQPDFSKLIRYNDAKLRLALGRCLNWSEKDAALVYDEAAGVYVLQPHQEGLRTDHNALAGVLREAIRSLTPQYAATGFSEVLQPMRYADDPAAQAALEQINKMTSAVLSYTFGAGSSDPTVHTIAPEAIRSFVTLGEDGFTPSVNMDAITAYAEELAAEHFVPARMDAFRTIGGKDLDMLVSYKACQVDVPVLAEDIRFFVQYGLSAERSAPYVGSSNPDMAFGGNYVEVDLDSQHLWLFQDGKCILDTDLVSGDASLKRNTPNGVFYIYSRIRSTNLVGADYVSYVNYWMPFYRGYGLHDATWRDEFGGDIYLDDGSHGCVNLPLEAAKTLFNNSSSGNTRVILYGGEGAVPMSEQVLQGKLERNVTVDDEPFDLNIHSKYAWPDYYYESDNPQVATVDEYGEVTVHDIGTAHITVTCTTESIYLSASTTVTVNVQAADQETA